METEKHQHARLGLLYGLSAYGLWGIVPLYFRMLRHLPPIEVLSHRVFWSFLVLSLLITATHRWFEVWKAIRAPRVMLCLTASTVLIAVNWYTYIYSVAHQHVLESSLGYFLTPLVNVLLGMIFFGERLKPLQMLSLLLASAGLVVFAMTGSVILWLPLVLAFSFAFYGLMRKTVDANAATGLFVETLLLAPVAIGLLCFRQFHGIAQSISVDGETWIKLMLSGIITTIPLLLFAGAARRLRMSTLGFLQYLSPSLQFLLAVLVFREPFTSIRLVSFALIWTAVAIYSLDSLVAYHTGRELADELAADPRSKM